MAYLQSCSMSLMLFMRNITTFDIVLTNKFYKDLGTMSLLSFKYH